MSLRAVCQCGELAATPSSSTISRAGASQPWEDSLKEAAPMTFGLPTRPLCSFPSSRRFVTVLCFLLLHTYYFHIARCYVRTSLSPHLAVHLHVHQHDCMHVRNERQRAVLRHELCHRDRRLRRNGCIECIQDVHERHLGRLHCSDGSHCHRRGGISRNDFAPPC